MAVRPERGWKKQDPKCATEIDMGVMSGVPGAALAKVRVVVLWCIAAAVHTDIYIYTYICSGNNPAASFFFVEAPLWRR